MNMRICKTDNHNGLIQKLICMLWTRPSACKLKQRLSFIVDLKSISMNSRSAYSWAFRWTIQNLEYLMQTNSMAENLIIPFQMLKFNWFRCRARTISNRSSTHNNGLISFVHALVHKMLLCLHRVWYLNRINLSICIEKQLLPAIHFVSFYLVLKFHNATRFCRLFVNAAQVHDGVSYKMEMGSLNIECFRLINAHFSGSNNNNNDMAELKEKDEFWVKVFLSRFHSKMVQKPQHRNQIIQYANSGWTEKRRGGRQSTMFSKNSTSIGPYIGICTKMVYAYNQSLVIFHRSFFRLCSTFCSPVMYMRIDYILWGRIEKCFNTNLLTIDRGVWYSVFFPLLLSCHIVQFPCYGFLCVLALLNRSNSFVHVRY